MYICKLTLREGGESPHLTKRSREEEKGDLTAEFESSLTNFPYLFIFRFIFLKRPMKEKPKRGAGGGQRKGVVMRRRGSL